MNATGIVIKNVRNVRIKIATPDVSVESAIVRNAKIIANSHVRSVGRRNAILCVCVSNAKQNNA